MKITAALLLLLLLIGCGGTAASPGSSASTPAPTPSGAATSPASSPVPVTISAGQTASVDVTVSAPAESTPPNVKDLGVAAMSGPGSAFNTGDVIHRGQTARVLLFGPGLSGEMQIVIRGPSDISIASVSGITSTDNTPGVSFIATVSPSAALGARTVVLQSAKGDVTTFTGGLEVAP